VGSTFVLCVEELLQCEAILVWDVNSIHWYRNMYDKYDMCIRIVLEYRGCKGVRGGGGIFINN
jgi:hypothetical protein